MIEEEKGTTEDEMIGWPHQLNEPKFEQTLGDSEGQGNLACCSPWGCKESDTTEQLHFHFYFHSHPYMTTGKTIALTRPTFVGKVMSLLFNMLSRLVITFFPRSKRLLVHGCSHHLQ